ncbi:hypothetical protein DL770_006709 [Monosporascus sp. CRB-9-2]|nr:hypothetical protein DL770_006709 [Monosporascus sp. CRB-9-2]
MHLFSICHPVPFLGLVSAALATPTSETLENSRVEARDVSRRAAPDNPSGNYAPQTVDCPDQRPSIRNARSLSDSETSWLESRRPKTIDPMIEFFRRADLEDFDAEGFVNANSQDFSVVPNIGIAISGGGYRAMMNGAGFLAAADSRVEGSPDAGGLGHLLQATTYLAGLSGGGWLVGSIFANNFSTAINLRDGVEDSNTWELSNSVFEGPAKPEGVGVLDTIEYWRDVERSVDKKRSAGYEVSITDYWGRALSYQLINAPHGGPAYTFSSIADEPKFKSADTPMPILVADGRRPGDTIISLSSTVFEFNPWELGSPDPTVYGFAPTRYLGSNFSQGSIPENGGCVRGFDQLGFVMGTSSSLFNQFLLQNISSSDVPSFVAAAIDMVLTGIADENNDIAVYQPNPFYGYKPDTNPFAETEQLSLVDGGEDLQNIPLHPLIQPNRKVDVIFAVDSSADTNSNWPNGTALRATAERSRGEAIANGTAFPAVPDAETFINLGLNRKPTFFGCNTSEFEAGHIPPLIVYIPNAPYTYNSNFSTWKPSYSDEERNSAIENGWNVATMGNGTVDSQWLACAACAILQRSLERTGTEIPGTCNSCFDRYCWNGTTDSTPVDYQPTSVLDDDVAGNGGVPVSGHPLLRGLIGVTALMAAF